ncbi:MAG: DNA primase [Candidatus Delongbacteria bacterium]|nr:DNA primase [Candidatus Delongbacteria bacterium]
MPYIEPEVIEQIREQLDVGQLISRYLELKRSGANLKGRCPFHEEKTPSFMVSPEKRIFKCFGCGASGDVFSFIMQYEGMSYPEAVEFLAGQAGVAVRYQRGDGPSPEQRGEKEQLRHLYALAGRFYREQILQAMQVEQKTDPEQSGAGVAAYVRARGIDDATLADFQVGLAPTGWDNLLQRVRQEKYSEQVLLKTMLFARSQHDTLYDVFRNRLMFPLLNLSGKIIAFGGRVLPGADEDAPKYINSAEHPLYHKSRELYGLYQNRGGIRKAGYALMVEGYMDVIALYQFDLRNTVASMGTALTREQAFLLKRYTDRVTLLYDADVAGSDAAARGADLLLTAGLEVTVAQLPAGEDPDSFIRNRSEDDFEKLLQGKQDIFAWRLERFNREIPDATPRQFSAFVQSLLKTVALIEDLFEQQQILQRLARFSGVEAEVLKEQLRKMFRSATTQGKPAAEIDGAGATPTGHEHQPAKRILEMYLSNPELRVEIEQADLLRWILHSGLREALQKLIELNGAKGLNDDTLRAVFQEPKAQLFLLEHLHRNPLPRDRQEFQDHLRALQERFIQAEVKKLRLRLDKEQNGSETNNELLQRIQELEQQRRQLASGNSSS